MRIAHALLLGLVLGTAPAGCGTDAADTFSGGGVGAELRYGVDGEDDGDLLVVLAGTGLEPEASDCEAEDNQSLDGCVATDEGLLMWQEELPESDPGLVGVLVTRAETSALVLYLGPPITGDPRELELPIPTDTLVSIAQDPRVDVATSAEAVEAAAELPFWQGSAD